MCLCVCVCVCVCVYTWKVTQQRAESLYQLAVRSMRAIVDKSLKMAHGAKVAEAFTRLNISKLYFVLFFLFCWVLVCGCFVSIFSKNKKK